MPDNVMQPVGCATQSFVLQPLVGLLPTQPPEFKKTLWRNYWGTGELCVLTGDTGAGKTLFALQVAKEIATGSDEVEPAKILYLGHEYDKCGFAERYGPACAAAADNFFFAVFNHAQSGVYKTYTVFKEWLMEGLTGLLDSTGAKLLIFDQPDRLNLSNLQWLDFLNVVEQLRIERGISVLLIVNTRTRNTNKAVELYHTYKHQYTTAFADSVVAIARCHSNHQTRYLKQLKCKHRDMPGFNFVTSYFIVEDEERYLQLHPHLDSVPEKDMLPRSAAQERKDKLMTAESLRRDGLGYKRIADMLDLPESTTRSQLRNIPIYSHYNEPEPGECMPLPEHLRPGFEGFTNPFKDNLPEGENAPGLVDETGAENEGCLLPEIKIESDPEKMLEKIRRKLPPVTTGLVVERSNKVGDYTINLMRRVASN